MSPEGTPTAEIVAARSRQGHRHLHATPDQHGLRGALRPLRLMTADVAGPRAVHIEPSLMRMSAAGRLAIAAAAAAVVWALTLSVLA